MDTTTPHLPKYLLSELLQYCKDALRLTTAVDLRLLKLSAQHKALDSSVNTLNGEFKRKTSSDYSQVLDELDVERDLYTVCIRELLVVLSKDPDDGTSTPAANLLEIMDRHGKSIQRLHYQRQTSVTESVLEEWEAQPSLPALVPNVRVLQTWITNLKGLNERFIAVYLKRVDEQAPRDLDVKVLRGEVIEAHRQLITHIKAHITLDPEPAPYIELLEKLSELARKYNQALANRLANHPTVTDVPEQVEGDESKCHLLRPFDTRTA